MLEKEDWRLTDQEEYLLKKTLYLRKWRLLRPDGTTITANSAERRFRNFLIPFTKGIPPRMDTTGSANNALRISKSGFNGPLGLLTDKKRSPAWVISFGFCVLLPLFVKPFNSPVNP